MQWDPGGQKDVYIDVVAIEREYLVKVYAVSTPGPNITPQTSETLTCWGMEFKDIKKAQNEDPDLAYLLDWLLNSASPNERDLFLASQKAKAYWLQREEFLLIDGVVFHERPDDHEKDLVVPNSLTMRL